MSSGKGNNDEKNTNQNEMKIPSLHDQQILAQLLQGINQNANLDNRMNDEEEEDDEEENGSNLNNREKSQEGDNEDIDDDEINQNQLNQEGQKQLFDALLQQYQQNMLQQQQQQQQQQQHQSIQNKQDQMDEEEDNGEEAEEEDDEEHEQQNSNQDKKNLEDNQGQQQDFKLGLQQQQFLQMLMNLNQQNTPLAQLQQQAMQQNNTQRSKNPSQGQIQAINKKEEEDDDEENDDENENKEQILSQANSLEKLRLQRLLQAQQAQFQNGDDDEDLESQIRNLQQFQNNRLKSQAEVIMRQQGTQGNQIEGEEDEEEEEAKQAMQKQFLDKQYRAYLSQQQQQFEMIMNEIKILEQFMQTNPISQEQRIILEQKHQMLVVKLKQIQQHIQEIGMNPNLILEHLQHGQLLQQQMQKSGIGDQENLLNQQKRDFLQRNSQYIRSADQIGRNMQVMQDQEHNVMHQQQIQYQAYVQQQEKMQQNNNHQNHPLVNFFNSYSLFINDTANIQLDQEIVLNKLIENAKKCKPPSNADERVIYLWNYLTDLDKKQIEDFEQQLKSLPEQNIYECIQTIEKLHIKLLVEYNIEVARGKTLGIIKQ